MDCVLFVKHCDRKKLKNTFLNQKRWHPGFEHMESVKYVNKIFPIGQEQELESQLFILKLASWRVWCSPGFDSNCVTSWVDLSLLASVSLGERLWWRERSPSPRSCVWFCITWFASVKHLFFCLSVSTRHTMAEVFGNLLLSNNGCGQVTFIYTVFVQRVCRTLSGFFWDI